MLKPSQRRGSRDSAVSLCGFVLVVVSLLSPLAATARIEDVIDAERKRIDAMNKRFGEFTSDKNVFGLASLFNGTPISSPQKQRMDADGGNMKTFQGDMTYHINAYDVERETDEKVDPNDPNSPNKVETLYGWVSEHGAIKGEGGGSSELERKAYGEHEKYTQGPEDPKNKNAPEGITYVSMFKRTTLKAAKAGQGRGNNNNNNDENEEEAIERWEVREESLEPIASVGDLAFNTVEEVARSPEKRNDRTTVGNGLWFLEAGQRALKTIEAAAKSALAQRRINRGIRAGSLPERVQLKEERATCQQWAQEARGAVANEQDPQKRQEMEQEVQRMAQQCEEMSRVAFDAAQPRFEQDEEGKNETLKIKGIKGEDSRERDLRVQIQVLRRFGISPNEVPSEWQYNENDGKGKVTLAFDENGRPTEQRMMSPAEQLEIWNREKMLAKQAAEEANQYLPEGSKIDTSKLNQLVQRGQKPAWEITQIPEQAYDEFGAKQRAPMPELNQYPDLVQ